MRGEGYIFHIGTVNGSLNLGPNMGINHLCAATKCGVKMLAENLRMELSRAKSNIKVTVSKIQELLVPKLKGTLFKMDERVESS